MKRKVSLKLSSAAKSRGPAKLSQKWKGHHPENWNSIIRRWIWTIRQTMDTGCPYSKLGGWQVFTVTALVALASFLCVSCCLPHIHTGNLPYSPSLEEAAYTEMRCKCVTVQNPLMQGDVREWFKLAFILQTNLQYNYVFCFVFNPLYGVIYSGPKSSVPCSWRKHIWMYKTQAKNIFIKLTTHAQHLENSILKISYHIMFLFFYILSHDSDIFPDICCCVFLSCSAFSSQSNCKYICFMKRLCEQWLARKMIYLCGLHYKRYLAI